MARWEHRYLGFGGFPDALSALEIEQFFGLEPTELAAVRRRRGAMTRLAVALQIGFVRMTGAPLNSVQLVPAAVLALLGRQLGIGPGTPRVASLRALYQRRRTLFDHQQAALEVIGFRALPDQAMPGLIRQGAAAEAFELEALVGGPGFGCSSTATSSSRRGGCGTSRSRHAGTTRRPSWPRSRQPSRPSCARTGCRGCYRRPIPRRASAAWTGCGQGRHRRSPRGSLITSRRLAFLKALGADRLALDLPLTGLRHYARPMLYRKPAALPPMRAPRRTLELACFLRLQLLRLTDSGLGLLDHRIADLWRGARDRVQGREDQQLRRYRCLVQDLHALLAEEGLVVEALRGRLAALIVPFPPDAAPTKAAEIRRELSSDAAQLAAILAEALATLDRIPAEPGAGLPDGASQPFGPTWAGLIDQPDRAAALQSYRAATVLLLKRSLRNGSASVEHSLDHRAPADRLIPAQTWTQEHDRLIRVDVPASAQAYLRTLEAALEAGLAALDEAVAAGALHKVWVALIGETNPGLSR